MLAEEYRALLFIPLVWSVCTCALIGVVRNAPLSESNSGFNLRLPSSIEDVKLLSIELSQFKEKHFTYVLVLFMLTYIYKQMFAIPGSALLNVLAGALFGPVLGIALVSLCSSVGACLCYLLSYSCGRLLVLKLASRRLQFLKDKICINRGSLFYFLLSARLFPFTPNWLLNFASPFVDIPIHYFFLSVLIGLLPYNYVCVQAGSTIMSGVLLSFKDFLTSETIFRLASVAFLCLALGITRKYKKDY